MPVTGGTADKVGNRYETLWVVDRLLQIVDGSAVQLTPEPLDPDESKGIEFVLVLTSGQTEYWSIKRQTSKAQGWTISALVNRDERGRSILGDLLAHVKASPQNRAAFASTLAAKDLQELQDYAQDASVFQSRLDRAAHLKSGYLNYLLPLCGNDPSIAGTFLNHIRLYAIDERQLLDRVHFTIRKLFYSEREPTLDPVLVRQSLAELIIDFLHQPIDRTIILSRLSSKGIRLREWAIESSVLNKIDSIRVGYISTLQSELIQGKVLHLLDPPLSLGEKSLSPQRVLVVGNAGSGKSTALAQFAGSMTNSGIAVLPIRFDQFPEEILSTVELGKRMNLPESPALVLAGVTNGGPSALVVDQLDAISVASGRRTQLWSIFDELRREVERFPSMSLVVGCREFDLEHDDRLRSIKNSFSISRLRALTHPEVDEAVTLAGTDPKSLGDKLKQILVTPLYLSMFIKIPIDRRSSVHKLEELFDKFWEAGEQRTDTRLGRKSAWTQVVDLLSTWLSDNQQLSAPKYVLDDFRIDAQAMASEHILVLSDERYRFFHEAFFDYAFARRFAAQGGKLTELLAKGEQHLFRRAQVRQVLSYMRNHEHVRYIHELDDLLKTPGIRFHIKKSILQWLSSLANPTVDEWEVLRGVSELRPDLRAHVRATLIGNVGWFDTLVEVGFFDAELSSGDATREQEAVILLGAHPILETRSERVAAILKKNRKPGEPWVNYLRHVCRFGHIYHSREMFDFFLSLITDGTLDNLRPGFAVNDDWWTVLYSLVKKEPDWACEAIGCWFDRALERWQLSGNDITGEERLSKFLDAGDGAHIIYDAAKRHAAFAKEIFPRVARHVYDTAEDVRDHLLCDRLWSHRFFGDNQLQIHSALLSALSLALEGVAKSDPVGLDELLASHVEKPYETIAYLVLRAWTAVPEIYAERIATFLAADQRKLKIGYSGWSGGGSARIYVSAQAIRVASTRCSLKAFADLENTIMNLTDQWEARNPAIRGVTQFELLASLPAERLSETARNRLKELRRKFPVKLEGEPEPLEVKPVGPPIPEQAQSKMSDEQWLTAMQKYAGLEDGVKRFRTLKGGEHELAMALEAQVRKNPSRFTSMILKMGDHLPESYFDAILRGLTEPTAENTEAVTLAPMVAALMRVHNLPDRPCGRSLSRLIEKQSDLDWPDEVIQAVAWYAMHDRDPEEELWRKVSDGNTPYYGGDPYAAGINSTRGTAAGAIGALLFSSPSRFEQLKEAISHLANDNTVAVRSCAVSAILPTLNFQSSQAIDWFNQCISKDLRVTQAPHSDNFIRAAAYRDYPRMRSILQSMLSSSSAGAIASAARHICVIGLTVEEVKADLETVHQGSAVARKAAAEVYARNAAHDLVGQLARSRLLPFLSDPDEEVRREAASVFQQFSGMQSADQAILLKEFLRGKPKAAALEVAVRAFEDSPVQLPDLVCDLAERCVEEFRSDAGDIAKTGSLVGMDLSKIVVRLYAQTNTLKIQSRCLDLIDDMERFHFMGLSEELQKVNR